jgi:hypothetical protein
MVDISLDNRAAQLVRDAKAAIVHADRQLSDHSLKIAKMELELRDAVVVSTGVGVSVTPFGFGADISADRDHADSTSIHLSLVPDREAVELEASAPEDFVAAIVAISAAAAAAAEAPPRFDLDGAVVAFDIDVTTKGEFQFFLHGSRSGGTGSTVTISLAPA